MHASVKLLPATALLFLFCQPALAASGARSAIEAANARFAAAFNKGDAQAAGAAYAEDAEVLPPGQPVIKGRTGIEAFWKGAIGAGLANLKLTTEEVEANGDMAVEVGSVRYDMPATGGGKTAATGKYVVVWKKKGKDWMLYRDIWNDNPAK